MVGMDEIAEDTGRLISVLDCLESRHDDAAHMLLRLAAEAKDAPDKTAEACREAAETASTAEQMQAVAGMIEDILRKRRAEAEQAACLALQYAYEAAELAAYTVLCWGDGRSEAAAQQAVYNRDLLDRIKTMRCCWVSPASWGA